ncbi:MAG: YibE/F family protein [Bacilli bacterium]|jgi:uncharacterized membrane protein|nr:YibE/F family protein [Bacilli bacterium]
MKKQVIAYILAIIFGICFVFFGHKFLASKTVNFNDYDIELKSAFVTSVDEPDSSGQIEFQFFFSKGSDETLHTGSQDTGGGTILPVKVGDNILVGKDDTSSNNYIFYDFYRVDHMVYVLVAFLILVIAFGRFKGFNTIISLMFTLMSLFYVFLPAVLNGQNVYVIGIMTLCAVLLFTLIVVHGFNLKSLGSGIATLLGIGFAAIIMVIASKFLYFTGLSGEDAMYLKLNSQNIVYDIKGIFFISIIMGGLGAIMDVAISIASSVAELKENNPNITFKEMVISGFNIGRDILGTMVNTLVLAYVSSSFFTILVVIAYNNDLIQIFNKEFLLANIFEPLIGCFGIVATLPLASIVCAYLFSHFKLKKDVDIPEKKFPEVEFPKIEPKNNNL